MDTNGIMVRDFKATVQEMALAGMAAYRMRFGIEPAVVFISQGDNLAVEGVEVRQVRWVMPHNVFVNGPKDGS